MHSFAMLTINADAHPLMQLFHKPTDEKRMVVILPAGAYQDWLCAAAAQQASFLVPYPAVDLIAEPATA